MFFFFITVPIQSIYAPPPPDHKDSFRISDIVLIGTITSSEIIIDEREDTEHGTYFDTIVYQVNVQHYLKNPLDDNVITVYGTHYPNDVSTEPQWGVVEFEIGEQVFLYVSETEDGYIFGDYSSWSLDKQGSICDENNFYKNGECMASQVCPPDAIHVGDFCGIIDTKTTNEEEISRISRDCVIATATYGSELAPQVQMLREVRDNTLLSTHSGALFMENFNTIYYSFSPKIAQLENENLIFKEGVKAFITPMIAALSIMTLADQGSEIQVIIYGISTIGLIVGIYLVVPVALIWKIKKINEV